MEEQKEAAPKRERCETPDGKELDVMALPWCAYWEVRCQGIVIASGTVAEPKKPSPGFSAFDSAKMCAETCANDSMLIAKRLLLFERSLREFC